MPLPKFLRRKHNTPRVHGASDQKATRAFVWNRSQIANQWILLATPLLVLGLGLIGYAAFALSLNAPAGYIDSPSPGATVSGGVTISGWAVAASLINHVDIVVNGVPARASYGTGGARPDVCGLYPQSPNCANGAQVGWQYSFNSSAIPNGSYSLYAVIYGSSGGVSSTPTQNFIVANGPPFGYIDTPTSGATVSGTINVAGWALDNETPISQITMSIDALPTAYYPIYGADRPDVCAAYPGRPGCNAVGFNYSLDTTNIPNGAHTIHITAYDSDGIQRSVTLDSGFTISNAGPPPIIGGPGTNPGGGGGGTSNPPPGGGGNPPPPAASGNPDGYIDDPPPPTPASQGNPPSPPNPFSGAFMQFDGWAIDKESVISQVNIVIDGITVGVARYGNTGVPRPDVCSTHANWVNCPSANIGWQFSYDTNKLTNGIHTVKASISDGDYPQHYFLTPGRDFTVKNAAPPTGGGGGTTPPISTSANPVGYVDNPPPNSPSPPNPYTNTMTFNGWAIDAQSAISKVDILIDGNKAVGTASYGTGNPRPDICATHVGYVKCPTAQTAALVGWQFGYDSHNLSNGAHTIQAYITDSDSVRHTYLTPIRSFSVSNSTALPNPAGAIDNMSVGGNLITNNTVYDTATFAGWAADTPVAPQTRISRVDFIIDNIAVGFASWGTGGPRPDICAKYANPPGCPNVGWQFSYDTTQLQNGTHTIAISVADSDLIQHYYRTPAKTITVNNLPTPGGGGGSNLPPDVHIDSITGDDLTTVKGWAIDNTTKAESGINPSIDVSINQNSIGVASYGIARPDVCAAYPGRTGCPNVGFVFFLDTSQYVNGSYSLTIHVVDDTGVSGYATKSFTVFHQNPTNNPNPPPATCNNYTGRSTCDKPDDFSGPQVHLLYVTPSDGRDRQLDVNGGITTSVTSSQSWMAKQTSGRSIKYDTYAGGTLDVSFIRTSHPSSYYQSQGANLILDLEADAQAAGFDSPGKIYPIFFEGGSVFACGASFVPGRYPYISFTSSYSPSLGGYQCSFWDLTKNASAPGFLDLALLHEEFHSLGAVQSCAPHSNNNTVNAPVGSLYHVSDPNDLMSVFGVPPTGQAQLDPGNDDYFGANVVNCLNVANSPFIK